MKAIAGDRIKGCSSWAYYLTVFLLSAFIVATFLLKVETNYRHTQKFVTNLAQLRNSASPKPNQKAQQHSVHPIPSTYTS